MTDFVVQKNYMKSNSDGMIQISKQHIQKIEIVLEKTMEEFNSIQLKTHNYNHFGNIKQFFEIYNICLHEVCDELSLYDLDFIGMILIRIFHAFKHHFTESLKYLIQIVSELGEKDIMTKNPFEFIQLQKKQSDKQECGINKWEHMEKAAHILQREQLQLEEMLDEYSAQSLELDVLLENKKGLKINASNASKQLESIYQKNVKQNNLLENMVSKGDKDIESRNQKDKSVQIIGLLKENVLKRFGQSHKDLMIHFYEYIKNSQVKPKTVDRELQTVPMEEVVPKHIIQQMDQMDLDMEALRTKNKSLNNNIKNLETQLSQANNQIQQLEIQIKKLNYTFIQKEKKENEAINLYKQLKSEITEERQGQFKLQQFISFVITETVLKNQISHLKSDLTQKLQIYKDVVEEKKKLIQEQNIQEKEYIDTIEQKNQKILSLEEDLESLTGKLKQQVIDLEEQLQENQSQNEDTQHQLNKFQNKIQNFYSNRKLCQTQGLILKKYLKTSEITQTDPIKPPSPIIRIEKVEIEKIVEVEKIVEIEKIVQIEKIVEVEKIVEIIKDKIVGVKVEVEKIVEVERKPPPGQDVYVETDDYLDTIESQLNESIYRGKKQYKEITNLQQENDKLQNDINNLNRKMKQIKVNQTQNGQNSDNNDNNLMPEFKAIETQTVPQNMNLQSTQTIIQTMNLFTQTIIQTGQKSTQYDYIVEKLNKATQHNTQNEDNNQYPLNRSQSQFRAVEYNPYQNNLSPQSSIRKSKENSPKRDKDMYYQFKTKDYTQIPINEQTYQLQDYAQKIQIYQEQKINEKLQKNIEQNYQNNNDQNYQNNTNDQKSNQKHKSNNLKYKNNNLKLKNSQQNDEYSKRNNQLNTHKRSTSQQNFSPQSQSTNFLLNITVRQTNYDDPILNKTQSITIIMGQKKNDKLKFFKSQNNFNHKFKLIQQNLQNPIHIDEDPEDEILADDLYNHIQEEVQKNPDNHSKIKHMFQYPFTSIDKRSGVNNLKESNQIDNISQEFVKDYIKKMKVAHLKCGPNCIHLKRFYNKIGFKYKQKKQLIMDKQIIASLPKIF